MAPPTYSPFLGNEIDGRRRPEVDDDAGVMKFLISGDAVDDPVGADILGTFVKNRHARLDAGANDQRFDLKKFIGQFLRRRQHRRHDAGHGDGGDLLGSVTRVIDELRNDDTVFVRSAFRLRGQAPVGD